MRIKYKENIKGIIPKGILGIITNTKDTPKLNKQLTKDLLSSFLVINLKRLNNDIIKNTYTNNLTISLYNLSIPIKIIIPNIIKIHPINNDE